MTKLRLAALALLAAAPALILAERVGAHGDMAPQALDTSALPQLGDDEEWLIENPWRDPSDPAWAKAIEIGALGYNSNCARCHGLEGVSGGLAPDLRYLEADDWGDEWYLERFRHGVNQNGAVKMPAFGELLGQEGAWAIRTYLETRPDDGELDAYYDRLEVIRDTLSTMAEAVNGGESPDSFQAEILPLRDEMALIGAEIATASGAPQADSIASRAASLLDGSAEGYATALEALTDGLLAAR
ncbi:MAG: cytochrome c-550 PedF [Pseudomonadota bacterium]